MVGVIRLYSLSHTLHITAWQAGIILLTPSSDEEWNFPYNSNLISSRNVTRRKQNIKISTRGYYLIHYNYILQMNITDYVHSRCTVERVTIKTSLKVNGGEGGGGKEGLQDSHWLCIPPLPKEQTRIIKLLLTGLFEALSLPPPKKRLK